MWWHVLAPMWVLSPLSGLMFPCFHIWLVLCLLANVLSPVIDDAAAWHTATSHGHQVICSQWRCFLADSALCFTLLRPYYEEQTPVLPAVEMLHPRLPGGGWSEIPGPCSPHKSWPGLNINQSWGKLTNHFNICQNTSTFCEEDFSFFGEHHCRIC